MKLVRPQETYAPVATTLFAHQRDQSFCPHIPSFSLHLPRKDLERPTCGVSIEERSAGLPRPIGQLGSWPRYGQRAVGYHMHIMPTPSRTMDLDPIWTYRVRAPRTRHSSYRGNFTNPHFSFPVHEHSFIHPFIIHSSHTSKHCICNCCITTLRVASRSDSGLIRYERRPSEVRRPAREELKAASHQIELGEKNRDEPQQPLPDPT